jgi:hypothetical protein
MEHQKNWRDHVHRMPDCRLPKEVLSCGLRGKLESGIPQLKWFQVLNYPELAKKRTKKKNNPNSKSSKLM